MQAAKDVGGKRGRPTKQRQTEIFDKLLKCYEDELSAPAAAKEAKVNEKTAYAYYDQQFEKYKQEQADELFARQEKVRAQAIASLDKDIIEADGFLMKIREQIQFYITREEEVPAYLFDQEMKAMKHKSSIKEKKLLYLTKPTLKESVDMDTVVQDESQNEERKRW